MKLYELNEQAMLLQELLEDGDTDEETLIDTMEAWEGEYNVKVESYLKVIKGLEAQAKAFKDEVDRMTARKRSLENSAVWLKGKLYESMKANNYQTAGGDTLKAIIKKNGGKLPLILDVEETEVPEEFCVRVKQVNKDAIREALESGEELEFAHIAERGDHLEIK